MREELLSIIEKNSRIDLKELAVMLGKEEIDVANEICRLEKDAFRFDCSIYLVKVNHKNVKVAKHGIIKPKTDT